MAGDLAAARTAVVADVGPRFVQMLRETDADARALEGWAVADTANHVSVVVAADTAVLAGEPASVEVDALTPAGIAAMNDGLLAADPERDLGVLADRIEASLVDFDKAAAAPASEEVTWLGDIRIPASAAACHLLEELLVHGHDIATATARPWPIDPGHATLAIIGAAAPIVNGAGPKAFVDPRRAQGFRGRFDIRLRGQGAFTLVFDDGVTIEEGSGRNVDAHISADPSVMLLHLLGRISDKEAFRSGRMIVWGRRPWRLRRMLGVMTPP